MTSSDIVMVSQFGSKAGGTPGNYIRRYTSRLDATEELAPYVPEQSLRAYREAYDQRNAQSEQVIEELGDDERLVYEDQKLTDQSARLFGNEGLVYTREQFSRGVRKTENALDEGHTLITPVISFSHDYLKRKGVVPEDLHTVQNDADEGAYSGNIDQMKLRRAITQGMDRMTQKAHFVEPEWTGAIQVDTANVHAHLTLIETCDMDKVPKERFVQASSKDDSSSQREKNEHGAENLGERGKLHQRVMQSFKDGVDQELTRMQGSKPFTNSLSAHHQLVKQNSTQLSLEHTALSQQLVRIYDALPKGEVSPDENPVEYDKDLRSNQKNWRFKSNRRDMKEANRLSEQYVDHLFDTHRESIGYDDFEQALDTYVETKALDTRSENREKERDRLRTVVSDRLKEEMVNGLYSSLKPLRVVENKKTFEDQQKEQMDHRERRVVQGTLTPKGLQLALLDDESLKEQIADELGREHSKSNGLLQMEKRMRDYPLRWSDAKEKEGYYASLRDDYDTLANQGLVVEESAPMRTMYETEAMYHGGVKDKYQYLMDQQPRPHLQYRRTKYPVMEGGDKEAWVDRVHDKVKNSVQHVRRQPQTEPTERDLTVSERLSDPVIRRLESESISGQPLNQAVKHDGRVRAMSRVYDGLESQLRLREQQQETPVDKERFNEVKGYDMAQTIYDLDGEQSRGVSSGTLQLNRKMHEARKKSFQQALSYLEQSGQNTQEYPEYAYFQSEAEGVEDALEFVSVAEEAQELPKPLRRHADEDVRKNPEYTLSHEEAVAFNREFLEVSAPIVEGEAENVKTWTADHDPNVPFDLSAELIRLNREHEQRRQEEEALKEEQELQRAREARLVRAVPDPSVKVTEGERDREYVRQLFKQRERDLLPRYSSTYYEMSYNDPSAERELGD